MIRFYKISHLKTNQVRMLHCLCNVNKQALQVITTEVSDSYWLTDTNSCMKLNQIQTKLSVHSYFSF